MTVRKAKCHEADGEPTQRQTADVHELLFTSFIHSTSTGPRSQGLRSRLADHSIQFSFLLLFFFLSSI